MSKKPVNPKQSVGVPGTVISVTVRGTPSGKPTATSTGTRMSDLTDVFHLLSDKPLFRPKPRRLSRER